MDEPELPSAREWRRLRAEEEAVQGLQWTDYIGPRVRTLIHDAFERTCLSETWWANLLDELAERIVLVDSEVPNREVSTFKEACGAMYGHPRTNTPEFLDWLQAVSIAADRNKKFNGEVRQNELGGKYGSPVRIDPEAFREEVNRILLDRRVAFEFDGRQLRARGDRTLNAEVIMPVTDGLAANERFAKADQAYSEALELLLTHQSGASITAAGSALQEAFRALNCKGSDLNALVKDAQRHGFLQGHDEKLIRAVQSLTDWTNADRSNRGNAHWASSGAEADAQLAVHIVGSLILRLLAFDDPEATEVDDASDL